MDFIIGALVGAGALSVAIAISMAKAAKEADEAESKYFAEMMAAMHQNGENE